MQVKTKSKYLRISPKKMRLVTKLIQGMEAEKALSYLDFVPQKAGGYIKKTLKSAISNAEHNFDLEKDNLLIKEIFVNEGATLKRWRPRAFGRAGQIRKRSSHLEIILEEKEPRKKAKTSPKKKLEEPEIKPLSEAEKVVSEDVDVKELKKEPTKPTPQPQIKKPTTPQGKKNWRDVFRRKSI
jgi:large subunit ribosomal protein L22